MTRPISQRENASQAKHCAEARRLVPLVWLALAMLLAVGNAAAQSMFQITSLSANGAVVIEQESITGDDRGGIAASSTQVFLSGDSATGRFSLADLSGGTSLGRVYDGLVSNLRTETVYTLGNGASTSVGVGLAINNLLEIDGETGQLTGNSIFLSTSIVMGSGSGVFSGYDRIVLYNGARLYDIALPSGTVTDLGTMTFPQHMFCENWAFWGVAEFFAGSLHLVYVRDPTAIVRTRVPGGQTTTVAEFTSLSDACSITVSISRNRWYFHHEGNSQFGTRSESLGFANATFATVPPPAPIVLVQPLIQLTTPGGSASFSVIVTGTPPFTFQWRREGVVLPGATNPVHTISNVQPAHLGAYDVVIANAGGAVTSAPAALVLGAAAITDRFNDRGLLTGYTNFVTADSSGYTNEPGEPKHADRKGNRSAWLSWIAPNNGVCFVDTFGSAFDTVLAVYTGNVVSNLSLIASNDDASIVTLQSAARFPATRGTAHQIAVDGYAQGVGGLIAFHLDFSNTSPAILSGPASQSILAGTDTSFSVAASGVQPLSYQWYFNGSPLPERVSPTLTLTNTQPANLGGYFVVVTNAFGAATSAVATLAFLVPPSIMAQPQSATVLTGATVVLNVQATGSSPLSYRWRRGTTNLPNATNATLTLTNVQITDAGSYSVQVTNLAGSTTSTAAVVNVGLPPAFTAQPASQAVAPGGSVTFSTQVTGTQPLSYQWLFNGRAIPNATNASLGIPFVQPTNAGIYVVVASNLYGLVTSSGATLNVLSPPVILVQPVSQTVH